MAKQEAVLHFSDWAGHREYPVTIVGETPKKWRVRVEAVAFRMPNRREVHPGDVVLVPKYAVTTGEGSKIPEGLWRFPHNNPVLGCPVCDMDTNSPCGWQPLTKYSSEEK